MKGYQRRSYSQQCSKKGVARLKTTHKLTTINGFHLLPGNKEGIMDLPVESLPLSVISPANGRRRLIFVLGSETLKYGYPHIVLSRNCDSGDGKQGDCNNGC